MGLEHMSGFLRLRAAALVGASLLSFHTAHVQAQEPAACLSFDPADWPAPSRPYFMIVADTSGSMTACTTPPTAYPTECNQNAPGYALNSCGDVPNRLNDAKCALSQTVLAFGGQANFGLASFGAFLTGCSAGACASDCGTPNGGTCSFDIYGCGFNVFPGASDGCGNNPECVPGAGPGAPNWAEGSWLNGGNILVGLQQDPFWASPPASNVPDILTWLDGDCTNSQELFAGGGTPIAGALTTTAQYLRAGWSLWTETNYCNNPSYTHPTPMDAQDRACRNVNVLLVTDGDDTCQGTAAAVAAAGDLFNNGVTIGSTTWPVRTHVINFAGGNQANTDAIAAAGGTTSSLFATNEVQLAQALSSIVAGAVQPESCDNGDNNCNGCTDEGYKHYCNTGQTCCSWSTQPQRDTCFADYQASVVANPPEGDLTLLPCTTPTQQTEPANWLCQNPGDICDEADNNCQDGVDEGQLKCGNPATCPTPEICNGQDDDCNGQIDDGGVCGTCSPSPEVCDGCDNDCNGIVDDGAFPPLSCGLPTPANCNGTRTCAAPQPVAQPGTCIGGAGYGACNNNPQAEVCDGIDNDCDGAIDEGYVSAQCEPTANPPGLSYGPPSVCNLGQTACVGGAVVCQGGTGPQSSELCDGLDNDCNGLVDDGTVFGVGQECGINSPPCTPGNTACVNGALVCQGGVGPQPEICDGVDNDCDANIDEAPLADAPAQPGCWNSPGTCCTQPNANPVIADLNWCPPSGGTCTGTGTLAAPCNTGTLQCSGGGWICNGGTLPSAEVCDGLDNDCSGIPDDGTLPQVGNACGSNVPPCMQGNLACVVGVLDCVGDVGPQPEICDGVDNDCNTTVDDNIPNGGPCSIAYDMVAYPNSNPALPPCQQGILQCDFSNPTADMNGFICLGGVGPTPELCDAIDNDCDGSVDEAGTAPDGIDGSANPNPPPAASIGEACGVTVGACDPGNYACVNGLFACLGGTGPVVETCDCEDNDCDGAEDEAPGMGEPVLCSPGKDCVKAPGFCQCAEQCSGGEFQCPPGQLCVDVEIQGSGGVTAAYCVTDFDALCGECETKTIDDGMGTTVCAPASANAPGCLDLPECQCKGPNGCREPCFNVDCSAGTVCSNFGPTPGECVADICFQTGCPGCDKACSGGACVDNPCTPDSCPPNQVANPSADFMTCDCVESCAGVECAGGQMCVDGQCIDWCNPDCGQGQVCDPSTVTCVDDMCTEDSCPDGSYCDPLTGGCGDHPCEGVICPDGQTCEMGSCFDDEAGTGGGGGATGGTGGTGGSTTAVGAGGAKGEQSGVFGLPTGGGGCACELSAQPKSNGHWLALLGLALATGTRRRRRRRGEGRATR
jgi:MYXO-CTERM domain-containing protein